MRPLDHIRCRVLHIPERGVTSITLSASPVLLPRNSESISTMFFTGVVVLYALLCGVASRQFEIPRVNAVVDNVLQEYEAYVDYNHSVSEHHAVTKRQATPYWYEDITHQGISAFGPSGYVVYRNVKDYGAKGSNLR